MGKKKVEEGEGIWLWGGKAAILKRVARIVLFQKLTFEQRLERSEGGPYTHLQDKHFRLGEQPVQRPQAEVGLEFSRKKAAILPSSLKEEGSMTVGLPTLYQTEKRRFYN